MLAAADDCGDTKVEVEAATATGGCRGFELVIDSDDMQHTMNIDATTAMRRHCVCHIDSHNLNLVKHVVVLLFD
jgi:hypothetical protein